MLYSIEERINDYLNRTGTTREALATDLGMSRQTFRKKVSGQIDFKLSESVALANILGSPSMTSECRLTRKELCKWHVRCQNQHHFLHEGVMAMGSFISSLLFMCLAVSCGFLLAAIFISTRY